MSHGFDAGRLARIEPFLRDRYVAPGRLPHAALLVSRGGEPVLDSSIGEARAGTPLTPDAIFRIASMTKPITSVAFMMLVEEGRVALSDPVASVLPEFSGTGVFVAGGGQAPFATRPPASPLRMIDLLRHTSGLTYSFQERTPVDAAYRARRLDDFHADLDLEEFVRELAQLPLQFDPGSSWNYSVSTDVLGAIVQRIEGRPFSEVLKERIFDPLGMVDTGFAVAANKADRLPDCYALDPRAGLRLFDPGGRDSRWARPNRMESGGGGLVSTLADYHRFCRMILNRGELDGTRILSRKTVALMAANHLPGGGDLTQHSTALFSEAENAGVGFGLGFATTIDPARTMVPGSAGDLYWGGMFSTYFLIDPAEELIMIFMTQLMPSSSYPVRRQLKTLLYSALA